MLDKGEAIMTKLEQWKQFSKIVEDHIKNYVVGQYSDYPDKMVEGFTPEKIQMKMEMYVGRIGRGQRGKEEEARDAIKMAHFMTYLYAILTKDDPCASLEE